MRAKAVMADEIETLCNADAETLAGEIQTNQPVGLYNGVMLNGRYYIERELAGGGMGTVYLAQDRQLAGRPVVVKVLDAVTDSDKWRLKKFKHEIEALARLDHPGVVSVLDSGTLPNNQPYFVMQYVEGGTLRELIDPCGMEITRTAELITQIASALHAAHLKGIIHRDLKPENIMVADCGDYEQARIIDFGIAKVKNSRFESSTDINRTAGTLLYMAPEQVVAQTVTEESDVYSLGVVAYEMLTGRRPFNPESVYQLTIMQREGIRVRPSDLRPGLPNTVDTVIAKALAFEPLERYRSTVEFSDALNSVLARKTLNLAVTVDSWRDTEPLPTRLPVKWITLAGAAALLTITIIASVFIFKRLSLQSGADTSTNGTSSSQPGSALTSEHTMDFSLTVQKMRDGKTYQEPFQSAGQEIFENGWRFRLNVHTGEKGFFYLLNEGPGPGGLITFNFLYPKSSVNNGSAIVDAEQRVQAGWYTLDSNQGTEKLWLVWSEAPVSVLEAVKGVVNNRDKGTIAGEQNNNLVKSFLAEHSTSGSKVTRDSSQKQTVITFSGNLIVTPLEIEHH
jgi:serine/threonine protein kinase